MPHHGRFGAVAEVVGVLAVVGSLVFVGVEIRQSRAVALSELDMSLVETQGQLRALMAEHADIWVRGGKGDPLTPTDSVVFHQLVIAWNDIAYFDAQRMVRLGEPELAEVIRHTFSRRLHQNPGARAVWDARSSELTAYRERLNRGQRSLSFPNSWRAGILEDLALLDRGG